LWLDRIALVGEIMSRKLKTVSRLLGQRAYLAGPIDRCPNSGREWRRRITPELHRRGIVVLDPMDKPIDEAHEDDESRKARHAFKGPAGYDDFASIMKKIHAIDLRMVNVSDFLVALVDLDVHACGTYDEISRANDQKKPVLVWCKQGKAAIPDWLFGKLPHELFFDDMDGVLGYLDEIAFSASFNHHKRWMCFDVEKLYPDEVLGFIRR